MKRINREDVKMLDGMAWRVVGRYVYTLDYSAGKFGIEGMKGPDRETTRVRERLLINPKERYAFGARYNEGEDIGKTGYQKLDYDAVMNRLRNYRKNMTAYKEG